MKHKCVFGQCVSVSSVKNSQLACVQNVLFNNCVAVICISSSEENIKQNFDTIVKKTYFGGLRNPGYLSELVVLTYSSKSILSLCW